MQTRNAHASKLRSLYGASPAQAQRPSFARSPVPLCVSIVREIIYVHRNANGVFAASRRAPSRHQLPPRHRSTPTTTTSRLKYSISYYMYRCRRDLKAGVRELRTRRVSVLLLWRRKRRPPPSPSSLGSLDRSSCVTTIITNSRDLTRGDVIMAIDSATAVLPSVQLSLAAILGDLRSAICARHFGGPEPTISPLLLPPMLSDYRLVYCERFIVLQLMIY